MKFVIHVTATIIVCFILQSFLPWWSLAIGTFLVGFMLKNNALPAFLAGVLGAVLLWGGMAFYIDFTTHSILTEKINKLLPVNSFLLTVLVGGLVGGLASLTGALARSK
ncbi:MAG: hypothetical protein KIT62_14975 [Cyclobacteriaceae bacterium]|nr:hypothetical protein [Cyclobacteriaceae bacterium]